MTLGLVPDKQYVHLSRLRRHEGQLSYVIFRATIPASCQLESTVAAEIHVTAEVCHEYLAYSPSLRVDNHAQDRMR